MYLLPLRHISYFNGNLDFIWYIFISLGIIVTIFTEILRRKHNFKSEFCDVFNDNENLSKVEFSRSIAF